jgi:two-component system phosphate regulon sensor histidine kinase PhoR
MVDQQGLIMNMNPLAERLLGYTLRTVHGESYAALLPLETEDGQDVPLHEHPVHQALRGMRALQFRQQIYVRVHQSSRARFPVYMYAIPVRSGNKRLGVSCLLYDVTKEHAENKAKTEFISLVVHQLRMPLTAIKAFSELLVSGESGPINATQRAQLSDIQESTKHMIELVESHLNISRHEMGTLQIHNEPTDMVALTDSVFTELDPMIQEKQLQIHKRYGKMPILTVDPKLWRIVIENLLSNAVKYTPKTGAVHVAWSKKGDHVEFHVKDTGCGIPTKEQSKIFTKLFRAENVQAQGTEGNGLGLYIAKSIIETYHGEISFTSKENKGTTFTVRLPIA